MEETEKYGLSWPGKSKAFAQAQKKTNYRLSPVKNKSVAFAETQNIIIEGDNIDALKLLQKDYENKIKVIYIDPPYNTGQENNFGYSDKFRKTKDEIDDNGRFHADWLNMMFPRLLLAKKLLTPGGVIFISIDDNEAFNLKFLLDEVFGAENKIGEFIWHNRTTPNDAGIGFATDHEFVFAYAKDKQNVKFKGVEKDLSKYKNPDKDPKGDWIADNPSAAGGNEKMRFPIENPYTGQVYFPPKGRYWAFSEKRVAQWTKSGKLVFPKAKNKNFKLKKYKSELRSTLKPVSSVIKGILTSQGTKEMKVLFPQGSPFKYPKPTELIKFLVSRVSEKNDIVMDFFAGSGSTAHAVFALNYENNTNLRFICVQLKEKYTPADAGYKKDFKFVSDITHERILRVSSFYKEKSDDLAKEAFDFGFKYYKLIKK